jgi:ABC-type bacteriocin/lantibiotic exporter with double-glycine peptidase domain
MRKSVVRGTLVGAALVIVAGGWVVNTSPPAEPVARGLAWMIGGEYRGRDGVQLQQGRTDCGVAVLSMLFRAHQRADGMAELRRSVLERGYGLSLLEMKKIASGRGLQASGWHLDAARLDDVPLPAVAHYDGHYVVVDRLAPDGTVHLRDPSIGRLEMPRERFVELWTGNVLVIGPAPRLRAERG